HAAGEQAGRLDRLGPRGRRRARQLEPVRGRQAVEEASEGCVAGALDGREHARAVLEGLARGRTEELVDERARTHRLGRAWMERPAGSEPETREEVDVEVPSKGPVLGRRTVGPSGIEEADEVLVET